MKPSLALTSAIKRTLRTRGISYARLAAQIGCSEASVKRMFARGNFDLSRLDRIAEVLDQDLADLLGEAARQRPELEELTRQQEAAIIEDPMLFTVAVCALHQLDLEEITSIYKIPAAGAIQCLLTLDKMGFLSLLPNNVYRLRLSRTFRWHRDGPIMRRFREQADHYLDHGFDGPGETIRVINVRISNEKRIALLRRIEELAQAYSDSHSEDAKLPLGKRHPMSALLAVRTWEPVFMRELRRLDDAQLMHWLRSGRMSNVRRPSAPNRAVNPRSAPVGQRAGQTGIKRRQILDIGT